MELAKVYEPGPVEARWYPYWLQQGFFRSQPNPDKEPYTIVIPPPNVTGVLHMGHMLNNTIQDILIRRARMQGKEACWVPGTDHASIATEAKVVAMLREQGIKKSDLTRDQFLEHAFAWKEKYGGIILEQLKKLGASCDWDRTRFTMEPKLSDAVTEVFISLYEKGLVYQGYRMVNWDPVAKTTVSDEEVIYKDENSKLYYVRYPFVGKPGQYITVATTRPETILADVAIAVNPADERYQSLIGSFVEVPLSGSLPGGPRPIPIIGDDNILIDFGTGCLKVTPAHDMLDYEIGQKHGLEIIDLINDDGTMNHLAGPYVGLDRFAARKQFAKDLEAADLLEKAEDYQNKTGRSERTDAVIEPRLSKQWFVKMKELAGPALDAVNNGQVRLHPEKYGNTYRYWMENVRDWCISRQLWWGQRIPAYYMPDGNVIVARSKKEALKIARDKYMLYALSEVDLTQDEDVVDTWFSSWLWPISVFDGFEDPNNADISYYYPTNTLVTAPEILFFWVARMIMAGLEYRGEVPFTDVYLTGIVRDKLGRKMSKSLGNSPDPLDLIEKYGADAVRFGMLISSPAGNDLPFDEKYVEQGRNFTNKIWNAFRLIKGWQTAPNGYRSEVAEQWFEARFAEALAEIEKHYADFRISDALQSTYKLIWDDFCSWYLEMIKPPYGQPIHPEALRAAEKNLERLMKVLHPFMPFISEEVYKTVADRTDEDSICIAAYPTPAPADAGLLAQAALSFDLIAGVRNARSARGLSPKEALEVAAVVTDRTAYDRFAETIAKLANVNLNYSAARPEGPSDLISVKQDAFYVILAAGSVDTEAEREALQKDLEYQRGFLASVETKLSNERFVANAKPDLVERERAKKADAEAKIATIEAALAAL